MKYSEFCRHILCQDWTPFKDIHFIIPPSLCEDISYVQTPFYHTFTSVQTIRRDPVYGLKDFKKRQQFYTNLLVLERHVKLIPSSTEMRNHAHKIPLVDTLDRIAKYITLTARPTSLFHIPPTRTIDSYKGGDYVFKRTHSAGFRHVIIPERKPSDEDNHTKDNHTESEDSNSPIDPKYDSKDEARWFLQETVPLLKRFECRVGICLKCPEKVIFRKWTNRNTADKSSGTTWDCIDVDALIDISTLE